MKLELGKVRINDVQFAEKTYIEDHGFGHGEGQHRGGNHPARDERPAVRERSEGPGAGDYRSAEGSGKAAGDRRTGTRNHPGPLGKGDGDRGGKI